MRKLISISIIVIVALVVIVLLIFRSDEDNWIKNESGIWIRHGNLDNVPENVKEQQDAINCSLNLYNKDKIEGMDFSSQCLGTCFDYAVDIVHVPRTSSDDLIEIL
jgi:hypothetical protein